VNQKPDQLRRIINLYIDNEAAETESAWLAARLQSSTDDLDEFVEQVLIEAELRQHGEGAVVESPSLSRRLMERARNPAITSLAAALILLLTIAAILRATVSLPPGPAAEWSASEGSKVSVSGSDDHGRLTVGSELRIAQGYAEITLAKGVRCLVQAPASFRLEAANRVRFSDGIAWFRVETAARGFEVRTAGLSVVDLGTEFGIDARTPLACQVHVFEGLVEVAALAGRKEMSVLAAGEAVALQAVGRLESLSAVSSRFLKHLPEGLPALHFDFEAPADSRWRGAGAIALRDNVWLHPSDGSAPSSTAGRFGKGLRLGDGRFAITNWPGIRGEQPRTVALWLRVEPSAASTNFPLVGWRDFSSTRRMGDFGIRLASKGGKLRIVSGRRWLEADETLADGTWRHVAVTLGGHTTGNWPEVRLYIDGTETPLVAGEPWERPIAPPATFSTTIDGPDSQPLTIGAFAPSGKQHLPTLKGDVDELIIAEGVLTGIQIRAIFEGRLADAGLRLKH